MLLYNQKRLPVLLFFAWFLVFAPSPAIKQDSYSRLPQGLALVQPEQTACFAAFRHVSSSSFFFFALTPEIKADIL